MQLDVDTNHATPTYPVAYRNQLGGSLAPRLSQIGQKHLFTGGRAYSAQIQYLPVQLQPWALQVFCV